jgi:4-amino-4-deoxy-L-arabinose transferase-like glycosyltransferase
LLDCVAHVALAAVTAVSWLGAGSLALAPLRSSGDRALDALNRIGAGALAFALATFAAGWLGLLYAEIYLVALAVAAAGGLLAARRLLRGARRPRLAAWARWEQAIAVLLAVYVVVALGVTCAPISSADALYHHAAAPELFEQGHRVVETPWSWNSYQPYTVEMLVTDGFLLWDSVQGAFAPLLLALAGLATVVAGAARLAGRAVGLLAGAVLFANPFALWVASSTFVEPGLVLMVALAAWNLARALRGDARAEAFVLAGLFAGGAAGTKYLGAVAAVLLAGAGVVLLGRRLTPARAVAFAVPAVAVALPWYVKNAVLTGNPLYPFFFGGQNPEAERAAFESFESYGHGESLGDLLLLPLRLLADADEFDRGEFASPLVLVFAPLAFLVPRARRPALVVSVAAVVYVVSWFFGSQHLRFLAPVAPPLAVLAALGIVAFVARSYVTRVVGVAVVAASLATGLAVSAVYAAQFVPVLVGAQSEREFLTENSPYYEGVDWLNRNLPPDAHVLLGFVFALHVDRPTVVWTADALPSTAGAEETRAFFRRFRLTHAAVLGRPGEMPGQLRYVGAREIGSVTVHNITSRTLNERGPSETMVVYAVPATSSR